MLQNLLSVLCIDESLGRLDYAMLSDQARLEIFFEGCTEAQKYNIGIITTESDASAYIDFCDWKYASCDEEGNIVQLVVDNSIMRADALSPSKLSFDFLPPKLKWLTLRDIHCGEKLSMTDLPESLENFHAHGKCLCTAFETRKLPRSLTRFSSFLKQLSGSCDLTDLPPNISELTAEHGNLTGTIDLNHLPATLNQISLREQKLSGPILITNLPNSVWRIDLSKNKFSGSCVITSIPSSLGFLILDENNLSGTAVLLSSINGNSCSVTFKNNMISALKDEKGRKHRFSKRVLKYQRTVEAQ